MQTAARDSLLLTECSSLKELAGVPPANDHGKFYQHIISSMRKSAYSSIYFSDLGNRLIGLVRHAYRLRQMETVEQISQMLIRLPLPSPYQSIGRYYHASRIWQEGQLTEAYTIFEDLTDQVPSCFRGRVVMSIAGIILATGDYRTALPLYLEANSAASRRHNPDWFTIAHTQKIIAAIKGIDGDHRGAVADLEGMLPLIRMVSSTDPSLYHDYLNSLAVEFGESGRIEEAKSVCRIILASPYASAYPEWRETCDDIALRGYRTPRSFVPVSRKASKTENVVPLPVPESNASLDSAPKQSGNPARVFDLTAWKEKMPKEPNDTPHDDDKPIEEMDEREKLLKIFQLVSSADRTDSELDDILGSIEKIIAGSKDKNKK